MTWGKATELCGVKRVAALDIEGPEISEGG